MERRYLVATVALALTFGLVSHGMRSGELSRVPHSRAELAADVACVRQQVAAKLMAKLEPYVDRQRPEEAQMVAELNLPQLVRAQQESAAADALVAQQIARQRCAAARAQHIQQPFEEMRTFVVVPKIKINDLAIVRAQELSTRAQEWQATLNEHNLEIQIRTLEHAQEASARAMERAQRAWEKSQRKHAVPAITPSAIHVNFTAPTPMIVVPAAPAAPELPSFTIQ
jgi:hypothetical protein